MRVRGRCRGDIPKCLVAHQPGDGTAASTLVGQLLVVHKLEAG